VLIVTCHRVAQNQTLAQIADRQNETNRALQFLVNKK